MAELGRRLGRRLADRLGRAHRRCDRISGSPTTSTTRRRTTLVPVVARRLGIPYVAAEASVARKRAAGPWAPGSGAASTPCARPTSS